MPYCPKTSLAAGAAPAPRPAAARAAVRKTEPKIQLNTRVSEANYQQLKLAAVLQRVPVQTLVEHAVEEFFSNHPELMRTAATASRSQPNATRPAV